MRRVRAIGRLGRGDDLMEAVDHKAGTVELARLAMTSLKEVQRRAAAGEITGRQLWVSARGAERFLQAVASGDVCDGSETERRIGVCRSCPSRVRETAPGADGPSDWCGPALRPQEHPATCGCLLAAKAVVGSEHCPQGRW